MGKWDKWDLSFTFPPSHSNGSIKQSHRSFIKWDISFNVTIENPDFSVWPTSDAWLEWTRKLAVLSNILLRKVASALAYFLKNSGECFTWEVWLPLFPFNSNRKRDVQFVFKKHLVGGQKVHLFPYFFEFSGSILGDDLLKMYLSRKMWRNRIPNFPVCCKFTGVS